MHHCRRCEQDVEGEYEHPRARKWARLYFVVPLPFVPLFPILASDFMVMIPLMMLYMLGAGSAFRFAAQSPLCPTCGAVVEARA